MPKPPIIIGAHLPISKGLCHIFELAQSVGAKAAQIFTKNNRSLYATKPLDPEEVLEFQKQRATSTLQTLVVHAGYLINLASDKPQVAHESHLSLISELKRAEELGAQFLVLHPGSIGTLDKNLAIAQVASFLNKALSALPESHKTKILLENMAGQGSTLARDLADLHNIWSQVENKKLVGFCLDTCHLFAAGYSLATPQDVDQTIETASTILNLENVNVIHVNDSVHELNERRDRHANIGKGKIGSKMLNYFVNHRQLSHVTFILETPPEPQIDIYRSEIDLLTQDHD